MKTWLTSDNHFGHNNIYSFTKSDGTKLRPWSNNIDGDAAMVANWNSVVSKEDKVYHLGDFAFQNRHLSILDHLNGRKVLIRGNHDTLKLSQYSKYFKDVRGCHVLDKFVLTHIPVHPASKGRFIGNIHGHTHSNVVHDQNGAPDPWYHNVCVEQTNFTPILFDDIRKKVLL